MASKLLVGLGVIFLLITVSFIGFITGKSKIPQYSINHLLPEDLSDVELYDQNDPAYLVGKVDVSNISSALLNATWTNKNIMRKGSNVLKTSSGEIIHISYYGSFFWRESQPGFFIPLEKDKNAYDKFTKQASELVINLRKERNESI